ncbi:hypothetical protein Fot_30497 [Forsythia ovata]|uniref:DUF7705 domain-containing protein n=1 Tax=Forsythia ovata TaxID=205694 RepID=A0ABD1TUW0_9LAMI
MIISPETPAWYSPTSIRNCPPFHITPNNTKIHMNDTINFPYGAYHYYCALGNAQHLQKPYSSCDPYSNPQAQELVQLLLHPIWAEYGYRTKHGEDWVGDGRIGNSMSVDFPVDFTSIRYVIYKLYTSVIKLKKMNGYDFIPLQDPGTTPARRIWTSLDVGTEIFVTDKAEVAEWTLSNFDVILNHFLKNLWNIEKCKLPRRIRPSTNEFALKPKV